MRDVCAEESEYPASNIEGAYALSSEDPIAVRQMMSSTTETTHEQQRLTCVICCRCDYDVTRCIDWRFIFRLSLENGDRFNIELLTFGR